MKNKLLLAQILFSTLIIGLALFGAFQNFSPIPNGDMFDGNLAFNASVDDGNLSAWWIPHNEHRVVLAHMLFWLDMHFLGGVGVFLIAANYVLVSLAAYIFWVFLRQLSNENETPSQEKHLGVFITSWLFLWTQENNLTWGFQSQFFFAQLIPLISFLFLARAQKPNSKFDFPIALLFGVLSIGTMANGVMALPLMLIYSFVLKTSLKRRLWLLAISAITISLYFYDYHSPSHHGHLSNELKEHPIGLLHYTVRYIGSPFFYLFGKGNSGNFFADFFGLAISIISIAILIKQLRKKDPSPGTMALILFVIYIGGTAFGTAGGRLIFGLDTAVSSRYTTPAIMAFAALLIALKSTYPNLIARLPKRAFIVLFIFISVLMLVQQAKALRRIKDTLWSRDIAALALSLKIRDVAYIENLYPDPDKAIRITTDAVSRNYSVFGKFPYVGLKEQLGGQFIKTETTTCQGSIDAFEEITDVQDYVRVAGWMFNPKNESPPQLIRFLDTNNTIVGFALTGVPRLDLKKTINPKAGFSGFRGYIKRSAKGGELIGSDQIPNCYFVSDAR